MKLRLKQHFVNKLIRNVILGYSGRGSCVRSLHSQNRYFLIPPSQDCCRVLEWTFWNRFEKELMLLIHRFFWLILLCFVIGNLTCDNYTNDYHTTTASFAYPGNARISKESVDYINHKW